MDKLSSQLADIYYDQMLEAEDALRYELSDEQDIHTHFSAYEKRTDLQLKQSLAVADKKLAFKIVTIEKNCVAEFKNTWIDTAVIHVKGNLKLDNCQLKCGRIKIYPSGKLHMASTLIETKTFNLEGQLLALKENDACRIKAEDYSMHKDARMVVSYLQLEALRAVTYGAIKATNLQVKSHYFFCESLIKCEFIAVFAEHNYTNFGDVYSEVCMINAISYVNFGCIYSPTSLSINALFAFGPGLNQSNNQSITILLKGPMVFLPAKMGWRDLLNPTKIKSGLLNATSGLFPTVGFLINVFKISANIYDKLEFKKIYAELVKAIKKEINVSELLPTLASISQLAISSAQLYQQSRLEEFWTQAQTQLDEHASYYQVANQGVANMRIASQEYVLSFWAQARTNIVDEAIDDATLAADARVDELLHSDALITEEAVDAIYTELIEPAQMTNPTDQEITYRVIDNFVGECRHDIGNLGQWMINNPLPTIARLAKETSVVLGPSLEINTGYNINGLEVAAFISEKNLRSINSGLQLGSSILSYNLYNKYNFGLILGYDVVQKGGVVINYFFTAAANHETDLKNYITTDKSLLISTYSKIKAQQISIKNVNTGRLELIGHVDNLRDIIFDQGSGKRVQVSKRLHIITSEAVDINRPLREISFGLITSDIALNQQINNQAIDLQLQTTKQTLKINKDIKAQNIHLFSAQDLMNTHEIIADQNAWVEVQGTLENQHTIRGKITKINADKVINQSSAKECAKIQASELLSVIAKNDIINKCYLEAFEQKTHPEKTTIRYKINQAIMSGGLGEHHKGMGALIYSSDGRVDNLTSNISAVGKLLVIGKKGINAQAHSYTYLYQHIHKECRGGRQSSYYKYLAEVFCANFSSQKDRILLISDEEINTLACNFASQYGTQMRAKKILLRDLITSSYEFYTRSGALSQSSEESINTQCIATRVQNFKPGVTQFIAQESIKFMNAQINCRGLTIAIAPEMDYVRGKLTHEFNMKKKGLIINPLGILDNKIEQIKNYQHPLIENAQAVMDSQNLPEVMANLSSTVITGVETANELVDAVNNQGLIPVIANQMGLGPIINPSTSIQLYSAKNSLSYQAPTASSFITDYLIMKANLLTLDGMPIIVLNNAIITANILNQIGLPLEFRQSSTFRNLSATISVGGQLLGASVQQAQNDLKQTIYLQQLLVVNGHLKLRVKEWNQTNAIIQCGSHDVLVGQRNIMDKANAYSQRSSQHAINTSGSYKGAASTSNTKKMTNRSAFFSKSSITGSNFIVQETNYQEEASSATYKKTQFMLKKPQDFMRQLNNIYDFVEVPILDAAEKEAQKPPSSRRPGSNQHLNTEVLDAKLQAEKSTASSSTKLSIYAANRFRTESKGIKIGIKKGANKNQLFNKQNGQYISAKQIKEKIKTASQPKSRVYKGGFLLSDNHMQKSADMLWQLGPLYENRYFSFNPKLWYISLDGYERTVKPTHKSSAARAGFSHELIWNLGEFNLPTGLGSIHIDLNGGSISGMLRGTIDLNTASPSAEFIAEAGVLGPNIATNIVLKPYEIMGITFDCKAGLVVGVGTKASIGAGASLDKGNGKLSVFLKAGFFKPSIGLEILPKCDVSLVTPK